MHTLGLVEKVKKTRGVVMSTRVYLASRAGVRGQREGRLEELAAFSWPLRNVGSANQIAVLAMINVYGRGHHMTLRSCSEHDAELEPCNHRMLQLS